MKIPVISLFGVRKSMAEALELANSCAGPAAVAELWLPALPPSPPGPAQFAVAYLVVTEQLEQEIQEVLK